MNMKVDLPIGTYVVAVSGGVDSMVLLDVLAKMASDDYHFVVAHFDHGVRADSDEDRKFVEATAEKYGLPFVFDRGNLGAGASEEAARKARYAFLNRVRAASGAQAIITAHHQDDLVETAFINLLRGTNRRGLTSLRSTGEIVRPFLGYRKQQLLDYAREHGLVWHEDSTNQDTSYLRNHVRHDIIPKLTSGQRAQIVATLQELTAVNQTLDEVLLAFLSKQPDVQTIDRSQFIQLPHAVSREVMAAWLRANGVRGYDQKTLERLVVAAKTYASGKVADVQRGYKMRLSVKYLTLIGSNTSDQSV